MPFFSLRSADVYKSLAGIRYYWMREKVNSHSEATNRCQAFNMDVATSQDNTFDLTAIGYAFDTQFSSDNFLKMETDTTGRHGFDLLCQSKFENMGLMVELLFHDSQL